jgi:tetratricopeptide (TPR) repeat protein
MSPITRPTPDAETIKNLVDASFACRYADLATMLGHSTAAVALVEAVQDPLPAELVARAWTQHGNALRLTGRYDEAERLLDRAAALPVGDLPTSLHLLEVRSSLDRNLGRYESAERSLADALAAYESLADPVGLARTYNLLGLARSESGDRSRALRAFQTAFSFLGQGAPLDILATTGHNLFYTFVAAGRLEAAEAALAALEPLYSRQFTAARLAAKCEWMRARLFRRLRRRLAARRAYDRAYELLRTAQPSPELAQLVQEMADV